MARTHPLGRGAPPGFEIAFHPTAVKEFLQLPPQVQGRFERAMDQLAVDPFRARPGVDVTKLVDLGHGESLYRLRVGEYRSCYAVISADHEIFVLVFETRGAGYGRMMKTAAARRHGRNR